MQKLQPLEPGKIYRIIQYSNGNEPIFPEPANKHYFKILVQKHLFPVADILDVELRNFQIELILKLRNKEEIPEKFHDKLHLPLSNLFNSYVKSINKRYQRKGSLFCKRFERKEIII